MMFLYVEDLLEGIICSTHLWREKMLRVIRTYPCLKFEKRHSPLVNVYTRCRETFLLSLQQSLYSICPLLCYFHQDVLRVEALIMMDAAAGPPRVVMCVCGHVCTPVTLRRVSMG